MKTVSRLFLVLLVLVTTACASQRSAVLVAWHSLDGAKERALLKLIDRFNASNTDGVIVIPEKRTLPELHNGVLSNKAQAAPLPALVLGSPMQAAVYAQQELLVPLDEFVNSRELGLNEVDRVDFYPFVLQAGKTPQGVLLGLPFGGRARAWFYNQDQLRQQGFADAAFDWKKVNDLCQITTNRARGTYCFGVTVSAETFSDWFLAQGGNWMNADGNMLQADGTTANTGLVMLLNFLQAGYAFPSPNGPEIWTQFANGRTPFAAGWSDEVPDFRAAVKRGENFAWSAAAMPHAEGAPSATALQAPLWLVMNTDANKQRASWLFIKWLLETNQTAEWAAATGELPARQSAALVLTANAEVDPLVPAIAQTLAPIAQAEPVLAGWGCVRTVFETGMRQLFESRPISETLQNVQAAAQPQLTTDCTLR